MVSWQQQEVASLCSSASDDRWTLEAAGQLEARKSGLDYEEIEEEEEEEEEPDGKEDDDGAKREGREGDDNRDARVRVSRSRRASLPVAGRSSHRVGLISFVGAPLLTHEHG